MPPETHSTVLTVLAISFILLIVTPRSALVCGVMRADIERCEKADVVAHMHQVRRRYQPGLSPGIRERHANQENGGHLWPAEIQLRPVDESEDPSCNQHGSPESERTLEDRIKKSPK